MTAEPGYYPIEALPHGDWWEIEALHAWDMNPPKRSQRDPDYLGLLRALKHDGQATPAVLNLEARVIIDGNRRLRAAQELGWSHLWIVPMKPGADIARTVRTINSTQRRWDTGDHAYLYNALPDYKSYVSPQQARLITIAQEALGERAQEWFATRSTRSVALARRTARAIGLDVGVVLRYLMDQEPGVVRALETALSLGINPARLAEIISNGEPLKPRW